MNYILFEDEIRNELLPLTFMRPVAVIRVGILTIKEKWDHFLNAECSYLAQDYLSKKFPLKKDVDNLLINGSILPNKTLLEHIGKLEEGQALHQDRLLIAARVNGERLENFDPLQWEKGFYRYEFKDKISRITKPYHVFAQNDTALREDFKIITRGRTSCPVSHTVNVLGMENIFIEEGARVEFATLNASTGPIYIGRNAEIMEGAFIRGPFAIGEHSVVKIGTKIYGATSLGPYCKCGGEIKNTVLFGYSNKAHEGFLGDAVIGEWCNIGADTNNSNLKNNYSEVKIWNYPSQSFEKTGMQLCGLVMGDHSKCAINTMFNTGTVVGVSSNIFGAGFPRNFIPSFVRGGSNGFAEYWLKAAYETAELMMKRRDISFDKIEVEKNILSAVFEMTKPYRKSS